MLYHVWNTSPLGTSPFSLSLVAVTKVVVVCFPEAPAEQVLGNFGNFDELMILITRICVGRSMTQSSLNLHWKTKFCVICIEEFSAGGHLRQNI